MGAAASGAGSVGPAVAGSWYPASPRELEAELERLLARSSAEASPDPRVRLVVVPHAGYRYSGQVAASAFRHLRRRTAARIVLVGPSHREGFAGAAVPEAGTFCTPLGAVAVDVEAAARLARTPAFARTDRPFLGEHSLEAELPFLQRCLDPGWRVLPVLMGAGSDAGDAARVADAIGEVLAPELDETIVVASTDFTHYGPGFGYVPFRDRVPERLRELDMGAIEPILRLDPAAFTDYVDRTAATICGRRAVEVLLHLAGAAKRTALDGYDTSGRQTGDFEHSVSYAGLSFRTAS